MKARDVSVVGLLFLVLLALPGCGDDDPTGVTESQLVGSYEATTFTVTEGGSTTDVLAEGGSLDVILDSDGSVSGTLVIPASQSESGTEEQETFAGTWSLAADGTVTFEHSADTFVRDMAFSATPGRLEGEETFGGETVHVILIQT